MALLGRAGECAALREFLAAARSDPGGTLVVAGAPGAGKTALVDHVLPAGSLRVAGFEAEAGFAYAALHRLLIPVLGTAGRLPADQRDALRVACGLADGPPPAPALLVAATSALLAAAGPTLCAVDDAQWIDTASREVLTGCAGTPGLGLILVTRDPGALPATFPVLAVGGLGSDDGAALLRSVVGGPVDHRVATRLVAATGGNPLALVGLGHELTADQLAGARSLPDPLPAGGRLVHPRLRELPEPARTRLLLAATEPAGDPGYVEAAARRLGLAPGTPGETPAVNLPGPLLRSVVYSAATGAQRRAAHAALAEVTDRPGDEARRARHRAAAGAGPDERVAAELVRAAATDDRPDRTDLLIRAAELTPDAGLRAERLLDAAEAAVHAGAPVQARHLADAAVRAAGGLPTVQGRALTVRADALAMSDVDDAYSRGPALCLQAATILAGPAAHLARDALLAAAEHAVRAGEPAVVRTGQPAPGPAGERAAMAGPVAEPAAAVGPARIAAAVSALAPGSGDEVTEQQLRAFAALATGDPVPAVREVRRAAALLLDPAVPDDVVLRHHLVPGIASTLLWDPDLQRALWRRVADAARRCRALGRLATVLYCATTVEVQLGDLDRAAELLTGTERAHARMGAADRGAIDRRPDLVAWRSGPDDPEEALRRALATAGRLGSGSMRGLAGAGLVVLALSRGDYAQARLTGREVVGADVLSVHTRVLPDLVEAAARGGDRPLAARALATFTGWATAAGTGWALGVLARSRALLAGPAAAEALYRRATGLLGDAGARADLARAHLLYGEWLRRRRRRRDAAAELRTACDLFESIGAAGFAARAALELTATTPAAGRGGLTPRELAIASLAAGGATNSEIAAQLFLSANTVDHHLRTVFRKLDVRSRRHLASALPE